MMRTSFLVVRSRAFTGKRYKFRREQLVFVGPCCAGLDADRVIYMALSV
jgi:hypothetical protein